MNRIEKTLKTWNAATGQPQATKQQLQQVRSLNCQPEFIETNIWRTPSASKDGVVYTQEVFFVGMNADKMLSIELNITCTCPAVKTCIHALAVERKMGANWKFYFALFGLPTSARLSELHAAAEQTAEFMAENRKAALAPGETQERCGCRYDWNSHFVSQYCSACWHQFGEMETERDYWESIAA